MMKEVRQGPYSHETQNQLGGYDKPNKWPTGSSELVFGSPVRSRGLDSMILVGPFQVKIFCSLLRTHERILTAVGIFPCVGTHSQNLTESGA